MKIALVQINPHIGNFNHNCGKIAQAADRARSEGCELVIFPEMAISGYPPQDLLERPSFIADHEQALSQLIKKIKGIGVIVGAITKNTEKTGKPLCNSCLLFENGMVLARAHKQLLPSYDVFDEARYFEPGGPAVPVHYKGLNIIMTICEDIWNDKDVSPRQLYTLDPITELMNSAAARPDLLVNLAASPFRFGKSEIKQEIFTNLSTKHGLPLLYVNQVGGQDSLLFDGGCLAVNSYGQIIKAAERFKEDILVIDLNQLKQRSAKSISEKDEISDVFKALIMGTRDYVKKSGFSKAIIGLSGGIDSALTAVIACAALGTHNITAASLPSPYSSDESIDDARALAANLGMKLEVIPITFTFQAMLKTLDPILGDLDNNVTEQNIQARLRGNILMALSNQRGAMLLSTGNKSEMAVGYCTLYGDMSGGLAVISDVPKQMVYELAGYINHNQEIIPNRTISKAPSAELAPDQKDEDDLPPYDILDPILKAWLEMNQSISEIVELGFERQTVEDVIQRVKRNEYKRKQAPLGLKVTSKAFGYGRRYPTAENYQEGS